MLARRTELPFPAPIFLCNKDSCVSLDAKKGRGLGQSLDVVLNVCTPELGSLISKLLQYSYSTGIG